MEIQQNIEPDLQRKLDQLDKFKLELERKSLRSGATNGRNNYNDYSGIRNIYEGLGIIFKPGFYYSEEWDKIKVFKDSFDFEQYIDENSEDVIDALINIVNIFRDCDYLWFKNEGDLKLPRKDTQDIICSYLEDVFPGSSNEYRRMIDNFDFMAFDLDKRICGETNYFRTSTKHDTIFINTDLKYKKISYMCTMIHEFMHKYVKDLSLKYGKNAFNGLTEGNLVEAATLYSEFSFHDYLLRNHIYPRETSLSLNNVLGIYLQSILRMKNYLLARDEDKEGFEMDPENYERIVNEEKDAEGYMIYILNELYLQTIVPEFNIDNNSFEMISNEDFLYPIGFIKAFDFMAKEQSGENMIRVMNEFVSSLSDLSQERDLLYDETNHELMKRFIQENTESVKKLYKMK